MTQQVTVDDRYRRNWSEIDELHDGNGIDSHYNQQEESSLTTTILSGRKSYRKRLSSNDEPLRRSSRTAVPNRSYWVQ